MKSELVIFLGILNFIIGQKTDIVSIFKICNRNDPELNDCLKESIQSALVSLADGLPELDIPSLDPYLEKTLTMTYTRNQISGKAVMKNIQAHGLSKAKVIEVRAKIEDDLFYLEVDMSNNLVTSEGMLKGYGRLNAFVFERKQYSRFNSSMSGLTWTWKLTGTPEVTDGKTYIKITKFYMRPEVTNMAVDLPPLFGDNKDLNEQAYRFVNENWRLVYQELLPIIQLAWEKLGTKQSNKLFLKIPYDELFPK